MSRATATAMKIRPMVNSTCSRSLAGVEAGVKQPLENDARRSDQDEGERQREGEGHAEA